MSINFVKHRKIYFIFSGILVIGSLVCLFIFGLKPSIDFTGGSILEIQYPEERPSDEAIGKTLADSNLSEFSLQSSGDKGIILKMKSISEETHQEILQKLRENNQLEELSFESIGPTIGRELKDKTKIVIVFSLLSMVFYIAFAFRKVSRPVNSWRYGIASVIILCHDVLLPMGIFAILGKLYNIQITIPIITALLAVVGYAINNVVVVYDRMRENILNTNQRDIFSQFEEKTNQAINQTLSRQINTSLTTLFPLAAIYLIGGETLKYFALTLILGIGFGTYSSIFLAGPLLVSWLRWQNRKSSELS